MIVDPILDGLPILNAQRYLERNNGSLHNLKYIPFSKLTKRSISQHNSIDEVAQLANEWVGHSAFSNLHGRPAWYLKNDVLHHVFEIQNKVQENHESWVSIVDSSDGRVLSSYPRKSNERGLVYPGNIPNLGSKPEQVDLINFLTGNQDQFSIKGKDVQSANTCFAYKCLDGSLNGNCTISQSECVDDLSSLTKNRDYFTKSVPFTIDGRSLDYFFDWQAAGYINNTVFLSWDGAAVGSSRLKKPTDGIWGSDTNFNTLNGGEQTDSFSELQAFQTFESHSEFFRDLLEDPNFCFIGSGPNCTSSKVNVTGDESGSPIRFFVNYQQVKVEYKSIMEQVKIGRGKDSSNSIVFTESAPYEDAFFSRGPTPGSPIDCTVDGCLPISTYPFSHFAFGQNTKYDWALNTCTVFHELGHALVAKFIPQLPGYTWTETGLRSDPGALNEGWSDYFAAIHCGISNFRTTYNGRPRRSLLNSNTCSDTVGQLHQDSLLFSGALWEVRELISTKFGLGANIQKEFDKVVLKALILGHESDLFANQFNMILSLVQNHTTLSQIFNDAQKVFDRRELQCERVKDLKVGMDPTFILANPGISIANFSTIPTQLRIKPRASDWGILLEWDQYTQNPWLGPLKEGFGSAPLKYMASPCPILLSGQVAGNISGVANCSLSKNTLSWELTRISKENRGSIYLSGSLISGDVYVMIGSDIPASMVLFASSLTLIGFNHIWLISIAIFGCAGLVGTVLTFMMSRKLPQQKREWLYLTGANILSAFSGAFAVCALCFGIIRFPFSIVAFSLQALAIFVSYFFYEFGIENSGIILKRAWIQSLFALSVVALLIGLGFYISFSIGVGGHSVVYIVFILSKIAIDLTIIFLCIQSLTRKLLPSS